MLWSLYAESSRVGLIATAADHLVAVPRLFAVSEHL